LFFPIGDNTPLLDGTGSGFVRGWVVGSTRGQNLYKVQVNWGQCKQMPPPKNVKSPPHPGSRAYSKDKILYFYAFNVTMKRAKALPPAPAAPPPTALPPGAPPPTPPELRAPSRLTKVSGRAASGWIPAVCIKNPNDRKFLRKLGYCVERFDRSGLRERIRNPAMMGAKHYFTCTLPATLGKLEQRFYTDRKEGRATHYRNRTPDFVSPCGYVNLCYNLPDLGGRVSRRNVGGVSCDTFPVGTPFRKIRKPKRVKTRLTVDVQLFDKSNKPIRKQRFIYGAVPYIEQPGVIKYRFGWVDIKALKRGVSRRTTCDVVKQGGGILSSQKCRVDDNGPVPPILLR
jgi:hypothetical protein